MKKKQILIIFTGAMELGGIERSLLGLLDAIDKDSYDVDLFLYGHRGPLFSLINDKVNILPEEKELAYLRESFKEKLTHGCCYSALLRLRDEIISYFKLIDHDRTWAEIMRKCTKKLDKRYDLAISFFLPFDYINEKVNAKLKVGWVHTDYASDPADKKALEDEYNKVDVIAAVSDECKKSFERIFPFMAEKTMVIGNILSKQFIHSQSEILDVSCEMPQDGSVRLLSVGRFCEAKNFDNVPFICKKIRQEGKNGKWYIIGYGSDEKLIREKIAEADMREYVIVLGKKENPYPYMKYCDIYVQPSRYEGKCVSVIEAQILGKPVVITNYETSRSQLRDGVDGVIVPMDNEECARGIVQLIDDKKLQEKLVENVCNMDYTNQTEVEKIYKLMENM